MDSYCLDLSRQVLHDAEKRFIIAQNYAVKGNAAEATQKEYRLILARIQRLSNLLLADYQFAVRENETKT